MRARSRIDIERGEHDVLSPHACFADESRGRAVHEEPDRFRTCFQCDRDRIFHCKSFRRLANKTQVFLAPEGDHFRTRLTHTLEVAQIARDIARPLGLNEDLTEAIALGHDLGHTPFGHAGERGLQKAIGDHLGLESDPDVRKSRFRHNEQSVRVLKRLEGGGRGLNLSYEVLDGIRCHVGGMRATTLEGRVVARADRIAYVNHDIDDAERAGLLDEDMLPQQSCNVLGHSSSERIETLVEDLVCASEGKDDILASASVWEALMDMRRFLFENLYQTGDAKSEEPKAERMVASLFGYYISHLSEVPDEFRGLGGEDYRVVADYISSMTDRYAIRLYQELFVPRAWSLSRFA